MERKYKWRGDIREIEIWKRKYREEVYRKKERYIIYEEGIIRGRTDIGEGSARGGDYTERRD